MVWYIVSAVALGLAGLLTYVYYLYQGQFDDPEDVKYQLFRDEE
jgi:cbb3-type cytochrome oxidase maturation protein